MTLITFNVSGQLNIDPPVTSNHNGYNISCFGGRDGSINITVTGGSGNYRYQWSNNSQTEDIQNLTAGYYHVAVQDINTGENADLEVTLTQPDQLQFHSPAISSFYDPTAHSYYGISLYGACNGSIQINPIGGTTPYTYFWLDTVYSRNRWSLCQGQYSVIITDANGCSAQSEYYNISEPPRSDWSMSGNAGVISGQFMGTTDSNDFVFKTNNSERLRIKANGVINSPSLVGNNYDVIMADSSGNIYRVDPGGNATSTVNPGQNQIYCIPWNTCGNIVPLNSYLGSNNNVDVVIKTNSIERMRITKTGVVGIGLNPNTTPITVGSNYQLLVGGKLGANEVWVSPGTTANPWPDYVFSKHHQVESLDDIRNYTFKYKHLRNMPSASKIKSEGAVNVGEVQTESVKEIEQLYLQLFKLNDRITVLEKQNAELIKILKK